MKNDGQCFSISLPVSDSRGSQILETVWTMGSIPSRDIHRPIYTRQYLTPIYLPFCTTTNVSVGDNNMW
jgi:hypothetical protein